MKIFKKICFGLCLAMIVFSVASNLYTPKAQAVCLNGETCGGGSSTQNNFLTQAELNNATYKLISASEIDGVINGTTIQFVDSNPGDGNRNFKPKSGEFCDGTPYGQKDSKQGITLNLSFSQITSSGGTSFDGDVNLDYINANNKCQNYQTTITFVKQADGSFSTNTQQGAACTGGTDCQAGVCVKNGGDCAVTTEPDTNQCQQKWNYGLEWLFCPVLKAVDGFVNGINNVIEGQLNFNVQQNLIDPQGIKQAWSVFRLLASALLVIVMLIMIFSQAISFGPFDAYTIRKLMPKMVAAVILIQISWYLSIWLIELANDLGRGVAGLLAVPFGGTNALQFSALMDNLSKAAPGVFVGGALLGTTAAVIINPFGALMLALVVFLAVITALAVLLVRQALIIGCVILLPIALVAWILPGTQKYWKLLWDNFIKALLLFPLIIAIIYVGRIFAWVIATSNGTPGVLDFFAIVIGFFGVYFFLPKTFKWGGTIISSAGNAITSGVNKVGEKPKKFLGTRQEELAAERRRASQERFSRGQGFELNRPWRRPLDLFRSGAADPTVWGRRKEEAIRNYRAAGVASEEKEMEAADQDFGQMAAQADQDWGGHDRFARDVAAAKIGDTITWTDRNKKDHKLEVTRVMKRAGMNGIVRYGTDKSLRILSKVVSELKHGDAEDQILAERFLDKNVQSLKPKMDYLYRGTSPADGPLADTVPHWNGKAFEGPLFSRVGALAPSQFSTMEAPDLEALIAGFSEVANDTTAPEAARAAAVRQLETIKSNYVQAINNDQIRPNVSPAVNMTMKALLDGTDLAARNKMRTDVGLTTEIKQVDSIKDTALGARISVDGVAAPETAAAAAAAGAAAQTVAAGAMGGGVQGVINIQHQDAALRQRAPADKLETPDTSGWTPRDYAEAENQARAEYNQLRSLGEDSLTDEQRARFEYYRNNFPNW